jgi:hypothetical protein
MSACTFHKETVNETFRNLDTSSIRVGESNWLEVLETLGPPTPPNSEAVGVEGATLRFFRYPSTDKTSVGFIFPLGLILPFSWVDETLVYDTVIEFDRAGIVTAVHQGGSQAIWRPFSDESDRPAPWVETTDGASR